MRGLGVADLVVLFVFVVLVLDSRRLHSLRAPARRPSIPAGGNPDQVGLSLQHIQMRTYVDWEDGGIGWDGPEVLPVDESDEIEEPGEADEAFVEEPGSDPARALLPVLWRPLPAALPAAGRTGEWAAPAEERAPVYV